MSIDKQISAILHALPAHEEVSFRSTTQALAENIPGVAFPKIVLHRDGDGKVVRLDVNFGDEIHDPSPRRTTIEIGRGNMSERPAVCLCGRVP